MQQAQETMTDQKVMHQEIVDLLEVIHQIHLDTRMRMAQLPGQIQESLVQQTNGLLQQNNGLMQQMGRLEKTVELMQKEQSKQIMMLIFWILFPLAISLVTLLVLVSFHR